MSEVIILGAGMVGVSAALELQARGSAVTLIDRRSPGEETSHGNAGIIQVEAAEPYAMPRDLATLWRYGTGRSNDLAYRVRDLASMAPQLWRYYRNSASSRHRQLAQTYSLLTSVAIRDHVPLIEAAGAGNLIRRTGYYHIFRDARTNDVAARKAERLQRDYGLRLQLLDGATLQDEEPALISRLAGAIFWMDPWSVTDPSALTSAYARLFEARGGRILSGDAQSLAQTGKSWHVETQDGGVTGSDVVVALGPWSPDLLAKFGYRIPMIWKRGYHGHYEMSLPLNRPILDTANGVVLSTMARGLRITTGAELVDRSAPANLRQLERGRQGAGELLRIGKPVDNGFWFGHRPCMADMLPVVGAAPRHPGLWFDFGHGHQGFTLGPTTARILADAMFDKGGDIVHTLAPSGRFK